MKWIESPKKQVTSAGWSTLSCLGALKADSGLDLGRLKRLLARVQKTIHAASDAVRYAMNGFVISVARHGAVWKSARSWSAPVLWRSWRRG